MKHSLTFLQNLDHISCIPRTSKPVVAKRGKSSDIQITLAFALCKNPSKGSSHLLLNKFPSQDL
jgi:hypothetical protein